MNIVFTFVIHVCKCVYYKYIEYWSGTLFILYKSLIISDIWLCIVCYFFSIYECSTLFWLSFRVVINKNILFSWNTVFYNELNEMLTTLLLQMLFLIYLRNITILQWWFVFVIYIWYCITSVIIKNVNQTFYRSKQIVWKMWYILFLTSLFHNNIFLRNFYTIF